MARWKRWTEHWATHPGYTITKVHSHQPVGSRVLRSLMWGTAQDCVTSSWCGGLRCLPYLCPSGSGKEGFPTEWFHGVFCFAFQKGKPHLPPHHPLKQYQEPSHDPQQLLLLNADCPRDTFTWACIPVSSSPSGTYPLHLAGLRPRSRGSFGGLCILYMSLSAFNMLSLACHCVNLVAEYLRPLCLSPATSLVQQGAGSGPF